MASGGMTDPVLMIVSVASLLTRAWINLPGKLWRIDCYTKLVTNRSKNTASPSTWQGSAAIVMLIS